MLSILTHNKTISTILQTIHWNKIFSFGIPSPPTHHTSQLRLQEKKQLQAAELPSFYSLRNNKQDTLSQSEIKELSDVKC